MALTQLPPLDEEQWTFVETKLSEKPSQEKKQKLRDSLDNARKIKTHFD